MKINNVQGDLTGTLAALKEALVNTFPEAVVCVSRWGPGRVHSLETAYCRSCNY